MTAVGNWKSCLGDRPSNDLWNALSEEAQVIACLRVEADLLTAERIEELCSRDLDWSVVLHLASQNDVSRLLYQNLSEIYPEAVPVWVLEQLQQSFQAGLLRSCYLAQELLQILDLLSQRGISALAYKGPALAMALYGGLAVRPFCDLDILIHPNDWLRTKAVLMAAGYDTLAVDDRLEMRNVWSDNERDFVHRDRGVVLDLHWKLMPEFFPTDLTVEDLWSRRQSVTVLGAIVESLGTEDRLLALCVHGAKECWSKLKWLMDVSQLLRQSPGVDWQAVIAQAKQAHLYRILLLGVGLAHTLLDAPIPADLVSQIQTDATLKSLMHQSCCYMFGVNVSPYRRWSPTRFRLNTRECWQDWVTYGIRRMLVPNVRDRQLVTLPSSWAWLYVLIRPFRLAGEKLGWVTRPQLGRDPKTAHLQEVSERRRDSPQELSSCCNEQAMQSKRPKIRADLSIYSLGTERIIYCPQQEMGVALNPSSTAILESCDGQCTLAEIAAQVAHRFDKPIETVVEDVYAAVLELQRLGVLEET
ncbi:MAG: nucleotidyltransferase family protein [Leptolyngbya sp. SIO1E4]|nr:nucleotidyltransferase family protein [Leptolyngbya sp. SIO1E4]